MTLEEALLKAFDKPGSRIRIKKLVDKYKKKQAEDLDGLIKTVLNITIHYNNS